MLQSTGNPELEKMWIPPRRSSYRSRKEADPMIKYSCIRHDTDDPNEINANTFFSGFPLVVSNMDTTGTIDMAEALLPYQMLVSIDTRWGNIDLNNKRQQQLILDKNLSNIMLTFGLNQSVQEVSDLIWKYACLFPFSKLYVQLDCPNGYMDDFIKFTEDISKFLHAPEFIYNPSPLFKVFDISRIKLFAGKVATQQGVTDLLSAGADVAVLGIGTGSVCTTKNTTGIYVPINYMIREGQEATKKFNIKSGHRLRRLMLDGGVKNIADISKAFALGFHFIQSGSIFSGHNECLNPERYYGMASEVAKNKYYSTTDFSYKTYEGKSISIDNPIPVEHTMQKILGGIRSAMTLTGSKSLSHLPNPIIYPNS